MITRKTTLVWALVVLVGAPCIVAEESDVDGSDQGVICRSDDEPLFQYLFKGVTYKPYVSKLWTPSGINVLRDSPYDHVHHHALMLALNVGDGEFWAEDPDSQPPPGSQQTQSLIVVKETDNGSAGVQSKLQWVTGNDEIALREKRIVTARFVAKNVTLLNWKSVLTPGTAESPLSLTGRHYHGLGMRFVESMDQEGRFLTSTGVRGEIIRGDERNTPCKWCAYSAKADGAPVTVAIFDHPDNYRPMVAFTMGDAGSHFAYLAATLNLWKEPKVLPANQPLTLCWGVAVWDGDADSEQIESVYEKWLKEAK